MPKTYAKERSPRAIQPRHINVWRFIDTYFKSNGFSPTVREIAKGLDMYESRVFNTINELVNIGSLSRFERTRRGIQCLKFPIINSPDVNK